MKAHRVVPFVADINTKQNGGSRLNNRSSARKAK